MQRLLQAQNSLLIVSLILPSNDCGTPFELANWSTAARVRRYSARRVAHRRRSCPRSRRPDPTAGCRSRPTAPVRHEQLSVTHRAAEPALLLLRVVALAALREAAVLTSLPKAAALGALREVVALAAALAKAAILAALAEATALAALREVAAALLRVVAAALLREAAAAALLLLRVVVAALLAVAAARAKLLRPRASVDAVSTRRTMLLSLSMLGEIAVRQ